MFVIELIYKAGLAEIDATMAAHVAFLRKYYAAGNFLISGRKIPRDGGIIVAVASTRKQVEAIMREDPFCERGLADFRVIQFRASQRADDIQARIDGKAAAIITSPATAEEVPSRPLAKTVTMTHSEGDRDALAVLVGASCNSSGSILCCRRLQPGDLPQSRRATGGNSHRLNGRLGHPQ